MRGALRKGWSELLAALQKNMCDRVVAVAGVETSRTKWSALFHQGYTALHVLALGQKALSPRITVRHVWLPWGGEVVREILH